VFFGVGLINVSNISFLTGNVVKAILRDFERIKKKISQTSISSTSTFREKVGESIANVSSEDEFSSEISKIEEKLRNPLTSEEENVIENQIQLLKFLTKLKNIIKQPKIDLENASSTDREIEIMEGELDDLLQWVMKYRRRFSEQELEEFNEELQRAHLMFSFLALSLEIRKRKIGLSRREIRYMGEVKEILESGTKLGK
jgi:hypothetical protein